jgi:hypothetical protein
LLLYRFLRAFPGYTAQAMLDEDAETVAVLLALYQMEVTAQAERKAQAEAMEKD